MSIPYETTGRRKQKARTRAALLAATRELLATGMTPSVDRAADKAGISRTTAYRYFPNHRALLAATYPEIETSSLLGPTPPDDVGERFEAASERFCQQILEYEPELRSQLRLSLEPTRPERDALPLRQGRAIAWLEDALAPLRDRLSQPELRRLVLAIRTTMGPEALIWLTDVAGVSREEAVDIMRSSARTLLRSAIADATLPT